ncbi:MAG: PHP domain-containing protein, partial [Bacilli bacterium]
SRMVQAELFDFIGHPDVIKVFGDEPDDQTFLRGWYERLAELFEQHKTVIEISTAGLRKPVGKLYPAPDFLAACAERRVPVVINSDAHRPEDVGADYDQAIAFARQAGYQSLTTFTARQRGAEALG